MKVKGFLRLTRRLHPKNPLLDLGDRYEIDGKFAKCIFPKEQDAWSVELLSPAEFRDEQGNVRNSHLCKRFPKHLDYRQVNGMRTYFDVPSPSLERLLPVLGIRKKKKSKQRAVP